MRNEDERIEALLKRHRVKGPGEDFKERVLGTVRQGRGRWRLVRRVGALAASAAAVLVIGLIGWTMISGQRAGPEAGIEAGPEAEQMARFEQEVIRKGHMTSLLASADLLARQPGGEEYARDSYRYIAETYWDTEEGDQAKRRLETLKERSVNDD